MRSVHAYPAMIARVTVSISLVFWRTLKQRVLRAIYGYTSIWCVALFIFLIESPRSYPSGLGVVFGPINWLHAAFAFGVGWYEIVINFGMFLLLLFLASLPRPFVIYASIPYGILWLYFGITAHFADV